MKPPMPYAGGKQAIADRIADLLPPHAHYVEPHAGALSVLLDALTATPAAVVLSGYASDLYDDALAGWERYEMAATNRAGAARTEVVWVNRRPADTLDLETS